MYMPTREESRERQPLRVVVGTARAAKVCLINAIRQLFTAFTDRTSASALKLMTPNDIAAKHSGVNKIFIGVFCPTHLVEIAIDGHSFWSAAVIKQLDDQFHMGFPHPPPWWCQQ